MWTDNAISVTQLPLSDSAPTPVLPVCFLLVALLFICFLDLLAVCVLCLVTQSCPTPCDPMDCGPPGSSVHGILQARIQEWVAMPSVSLVAQTVKRLLAMQETQVRSLGWPSSRGSS